MTITPPPPARPRRLAGRIAAWTAVATIGVLAVTGVALAAPAFTAMTAPSASPSPSDSAGPEGGPPADGRRAGPGKRLGLGLGHPFLRGRVLHGEGVVRDKNGKFVTGYTQRGEVTAVSASSITLKSDDGFVATYAVTDGTRVGKDRKPAKIGDVKVGDKAGVVAVKDANSKTAKGIIVGVKD